MMSAPSAPEAPALQSPDALLCANHQRMAPIPPRVAQWLRGLNLWPYLEAPSRAYHYCGQVKGEPCSVVLAADGECLRRALATRIGLIDYRLAVDPAAPAVLGIVVQDETQAQARRRR